MLRERGTGACEWTENTLSMLRARQLEASEDRLSIWPEFGIFSEQAVGCADEFWSFSFASREKAAVRAFPSVADMRADVLSLLPEEANFLSLAEHQLVEQMLAGDGAAELNDMEESAAAEMLVRRLWCWPEWIDDERVLLRMPKEIIDAVSLVFKTEHHDERRLTLFRISAAIQALLYLDGSIGIADPVAQLRHSVPDCPPAVMDRLGIRWLKTTFDYVYGRGGLPLLIHPGLADPMNMPPHVPVQRDLEHMESTMLFGAIQGLLPEEEPLFTRLHGLILDAVRPELLPDEVAEDLIILAKQNVPESDMQAVLASALTMLPTVAMRAAVQQISLLVPRWPGFSTAVMQ